MNKNEIILNSVFLKNRIIELGIKQWWLAEQVGVDRKTVSRWIHGKVKTIQNENAIALTKILNCSINELSLSNIADQLASPEDQKIAAQLITSSSLIEKLGPIGEWNVIEGLLKATIVPNLPLNILGELYNLLTVSSWRQSKIDEADIYNKKAESIGISSGDNTILAEALLSKANILSWRGKTKSSINTYLECLKLTKFIQSKLLGSTYSNLSAVLYESGNLEAGLEYQNKALEIFSTHGKPINLSIAHCHLAMIYLQQNKVDLANKECLTSIKFANSDNYSRGKEMGKLILAEISARKGLTAEAKATLNLALTGFKNLNINEGLNYEFAGRISRLISDYESAEVYLNKGISFAEKFPLSLASLYNELALTLNERNPAESKKYAIKASQLFLDCEAPLRSNQIKKAFDL